MKSDLGSWSQYFVDVGASTKGVILQLVRHIRRYNIDLNHIKLIIVMYHANGCQVNDEELETAG